MPDHSDLILAAEGITKTFPGVRALDGVAIEVRRGRLLALLGENGAGKSTLMNVLAGVFPPDAGTLRLEGRPVSFSHPRAALAAGIGIVFQELNLIPHLSVAENMFLGREPRTRMGLIDFRRLNADAAAVLQRLELAVAPDAWVDTLRIGQQQLVEIGRALSADARVLILDEPTSSLSAHEVTVFFGVIAELKKRGVGLVYITHKFEELGPICDEVTIMRDGRVVASAPFAALNRESIVRLMAVPEPLGSASVDAPDRDVPRPSTNESSSTAPELLRVESLSLPGAGGGRAMLVDNLSFTLRQGEVLGVFGLVGAGRTELLETLFGLHADRMTGKIFVEGRAVNFPEPAAAIAAGLALAPEDRKRDGLVLTMSVAANASLASLDRALQRGFISAACEAAHVTPYMDRFRVKTPSLGELIVNLSGGNQQKVILAKWLATGPKVLLLDEPTRGIDVNAKREIYAFIAELARLGLGLIVVSSELPEILALSDRVLVMCEGRQTATFTRATATAERVLHAALPDLAGVAS